MILLYYLIDLNINFIIIFIPREEKYFIINIISANLNETKKINNSLRKQKFVELHTFPRMDRGGS